ncbi:MAG TPA: SRPBCC family protein [Gaiellales bacterium]|jgi:carbon monoxide dehydrogenase subunit G|nr:SRPBCC family protein [Gaiellales bacterium]
MARYVATVKSPRPPAEVFDYIADFSTNAEWDPGTVSADRADEGPIGLGAEFRLVVSFLGRTSRLVYRIVEYKRPHVVAFRGENAAVVSLDRITVEPWNGGSRLTYDATLTPKGATRLAAPLLALAFRRVGDRALTGLRGVLASTVANRSNTER